jgi:metal-sulfur cluster biosynthetic enzyme
MDTAVTEERFEYDGPDALRRPIAAALQRVVDPEMALSIVDIGLVYRVVVDDRAARVTMTMTSAACPVADVIVDDVCGEVLRALPEHCGIDVEMVWEPPWSAERMSDEARRFMGW